MKLMFWRNKKQTKRLDELEREALIVHNENMEKLQKNREKIETLNTVLRENNIIFQLAHVIGHQK